MIRRRRLGAVALTDTLRLVYCRWWCRQMLRLARERSLAGDCPGTARALGHAVFWGRRMSRLLDRLEEAR